MSLKLYGQEDDGEFTKWLKNHPNSSIDEIMNVNFIDGYATQ